MLYRYFDAQESQLESLATSTQRTELRLFMYQHFQ